MSLVLRVAASARLDIIGILEWSASQFGDAARRRYEQLLELAIQQIVKNPTAVPNRERADISFGLWSLHLRGVEGGEVGDPRHIVFYRFDESVLRVVRVLHESRELAAALHDG